MKNNSHHVLHSAELWFVFVNLWFLITLAGCWKGVEPSVKEGKFHFSVTYEIDEKQETVSGVYVCEFVKVVKALDGSYIEWNSYVEEGGLRNQLEANRGYLLLKTCDDGVIYLDLNLSAKYFMADPNYGNANANTDEPIVNISPYVFIEYSDVKGEELGVWWSEDKAVLETYGVKLIGYEYDSPIQNSYK